MGHASEVFDRAVTDMVWPNELLEERLVRALFHIAGLREPETKEDFRDRHSVVFTAAHCLPLNHQEYIHNLDVDGRRRLALDIVEACFELRNERQQ